MKPRTIFRSLTRAQCERMLRRHRVARIAYSFRNRVDIEPIGYVYDRAGLLFRTSEGSKVETLRHSPWIALEIDEVDGPFDWRSVVAHGTMYRIDDRLTHGPEQEAAKAALKKLRRAIPGAFEADDPAAFRTLVMRLHIDHITGREARQSKARRKKTL